MKFLKIIASSFSPRSVREKTGLTGRPLGFYAHSQNFQSEDDIINLLKYHIAACERIPPTTKDHYEIDILIASSNGQDLSVQAINYMNSITNTKYKYGKIITVLRSEVGRQFGSFDEAYQMYKKDYDFFIFQEDDMICHVPNYIDIALKYWKDTKDCGFVPFLASTKIHRSHRKALGIKSNIITSCHGAHGMSNAATLEMVTKQYGRLPHNYENNEFIDHLRFGEIMFTYSIKLLGKKFAQLNHGEILVAPAYDLMRGLEIKVKPNLFDKVNYFVDYFFKRHLYMLCDKIGLIEYIKKR